MVETMKYGTKQQVAGLRLVRLRQSLLAAALTVVLVFAARPAQAEEDFWDEAGIGAGAGFSNLLYVPAKAFYASFGGLIGGVAWCLTGGDLEVANDIWNASINGTWVLTPAMLQGKEKIHFNAPPRSVDSTLREYDAAPAPAPAASSDTQRGDPGYGQPAPRYDDKDYGSGGSGWN